MYVYKYISVARLAKLRTVTALKVKIVGNATVTRTVQGQKLDIEGQGTQWHNSSW